MSVTSLAGPTLKRQRQNGRRMPQGAAVFKISSSTNGCLSLPWVCQRVHRIWHLRYLPPPKRSIPVHTLKDSIDLGTSNSENNYSRIGLKLAWTKCRPLASAENKILPTTESPNIQQSHCTARPPIQTVIPTAAQRSGGTCSCFSLP